MKKFKIKLTSILYHTEEVSAIDRDDALKIAEELRKRTGAIKATVKELKQQDKTTKTSAVRRPTITFAKMQKLPKKGQ